jgi:hypothetical protein
MSETADRLESLFAAAATLASPEERAAYLDEACAGDPALRQQVEGLLKAHDREGHFLDRPAGGPGAPPETVGYAPAVEQVGHVIAGRYKLLEQIGEGGMGAVWVAEQTQPVRRKVALKLVKAGMDTRAVLSRFEQERQALALMDHPNIAKVLDGGTTEGGRPFFAMEYVKGVPFTRFCDDARLSVAERLALFVPVCQAVQHAHTKGIIHRDLKPSNVLVCLYDGKPVPKVIDFGLAKAMHQPLTEHTVYTAHGVMVGTPQYMSPEQAEFNNLDVDTRTDVYSLGVVLYELLTGSTPLETRRFKQAAWQEVLRLIKEEEPPRPSTRLSGSGSLPSLAALRRLEPVKLARLVRGELDWIVMKCLEKDRTRRYETANGLARDLERYLADEPVHACPPSAGYRLRKFARKHRAGLAAAAALAALLLAATAVCTWQAVRATRARQAALAALAEAEAARAAEAEQRRLAEEAGQKARAAAEAAEARQAETQAVLDFVENQVFAAARPEGMAGGLGREVTLRRAIEAALPALDTGFHRQPLIEARLRLTLGSVFMSLGERKIAFNQFQAAQTLYAMKRGPDHLDTLRSRSRVAGAYHATDRHAEAAALLEATLPLMKAKLGPDDADTLWSAELLANCYDRLHRYAEALTLREETLALREAKLGRDHRDTLRSMGHLATSYFWLGRRDDCLTIRRKTLALQKDKLGPSDPDTLRTMDALAFSYYTSGQDAEALPLFEESVTLREAKFGPKHSLTVWSMVNLSWLLATTSDATLRDPPRALALARRAVEVSQNPTDPMRGTFAEALAAYGIARYRTGDWKGATADLEKAIGLRTSGVRDADGADNASDGFYLAMAYWQLGDKDRARQWFARSARWMEMGKGEDAVVKRSRAEAAALLGVDKKD